MNFPVRAGAHPERVVILLRLPRDDIDRPAQRTRHVGTGTLKHFDAFYQRWGEGYIHRVMTGLYVL